MISTKSQFYFLTTDVSTNNYYIDFIDSDSATKSATVALGSYSPEGLGEAIATALNKVSAQTYAVSFNRTTRKYTISASSNFSLLASSGTSAGNSVFSLAGFSASDKTDTNSYISNNAVGSIYKPQFLLQQYVSSDDLKKKIQPSINESASGKVEVVSFGTVSFAEMNIMYITDDTSLTSSTAIELNATGIQDARTFMNTLTSKRECEFMPDRDTVGTYETFILESTPEDDRGTGYRLIELYGRGMPGYFETGKLAFRKV